MEQRIFIHGIIGEEVTAEAVKKDFDSAIENKATVITLDIQSGGGDVYTGRAILGLMDRAKTLGITVRTEVFSYAYSMAAAIFQGATKGQRFIGEFGELMNHQAMTGIFGNADEMRGKADQLDEVTSNLAAVILRNDKAKQNESEILEALKNEKFIGAEEAIRIGLADAQIEKHKAVAIYNQNNNKMSENKDVKNLFEDFKTWFTNMTKAKNEVEVPAEETPEQLKEKITALTGELDTLKTQLDALKGEKETEVTALKAEVEALNSLKTGFEAKIKEVETLIAGAKSPEEGKKEQAAAVKGINASSIMSEIQNKLKTK